VRYPVAEGCGGAPRSSAQISIGRWTRLRRRAVVRRAHRFTRQDMQRQHVQVLLRVMNRNDAAIMKQTIDGAIKALNKTWNLDDPATAADLARAEKAIRAPLPRQLA